MAKKSTCPPTTLMHSYYTQISYQLLELLLGMAKTHQSSSCPILLSCMDYFCLEQVTGQGWALLAPIVLLYPILNVYMHIFFNIYIYTHIICVFLYIFKYFVTFSKILISFSLLVLFTIVFFPFCFIFMASMSGQKNTSNSP